MPALVTCHRCLHKWDVDRITQAVYDCPNCGTRTLAPARNSGDEWKLPKFSSFDLQKELMDELRTPLGVPEPRRADTSDAATPWHGVRAAEEDTQNLPQARSVPQEGTPEYLERLHTEITPGPPAGMLNSLLEGNDFERLADGAAIPTTGFHRMPKDDGTAAPDPHAAETMVRSINAQETMIRRSEDVGGLTPPTGMFRPNIHNADTIVRSGTPEVSLNTPSEKMIPRTPTFRQDTSTPAQPRFDLHAAETMLRSSSDLNFDPRSRYDLNDAATPVGGVPTNMPPPEEPLHESVTRIDHRALILYDLQTPTEGQKLSDPPPSSPPKK